LVRDAEVIRLIERIGEHYRANISNRFIRPALLQLPLDKKAWDLIEIMTEKLEQYRYQGFLLEELYRQTTACAQFVSICRRDLMFSLRTRLTAPITGEDKVLRDMAINTFASNLQLFADLINELYLKLREIDKTEAKGRRPLYTNIPELAEIDHMLTGG